MPEPKIIKLKRKIKAVLVPFGTEIALPKNTEVIITQDLGGTYTVIANGQMVRIANKDADALGKKAIKSDELLKTVSSYTTDSSCNYDIYIDPVSGSTNQNDQVFSRMSQLQSQAITQFPSILIFG